MDLKGKVAVVTGASVGLGLAFTERLIARGATVYGLARRTAPLNEAANRFGSAFVPVPCDVTNETEVQEAFEGLPGGRLDILINNAGLGRFGAVRDLSTEDWNRQIDTNLTGVFFCTRAAIPLMQAQNSASGFGGHIVNIASVAGIIGNANIGAYNATKFGLRGFSDAMMKELRGDGIKVTAVCPGSVRTDFQRIANSKGAPNPMVAGDVADTVIHILEGPDNYLISEVVMRPLRPRG